MKVVLSVLAVIIGIAAVLITVHYCLKKRAVKEAGPERNMGGYWAKTLAKYDKYTRLTISYTLLVIVCFSTLFPFVWMVLSSLKTTYEVAQTLKFQFFPAVPQWGNYVTAFGRVNIFVGLKNTLIIEVANIPIGTFVSALIAFGFSKMRMRFKTFWLLFLMSGLMVPYASVLLPQYKMYNMLGLIDTLWPLILPSFFGNVSMAFFFIQFMRGIPSELFEAARIDGCGYFKSFLLIMIPNMLMAIACQVVFSFVGIWNDFFAPSIYLTSLENKTLQVGLYAVAQSGAERPVLYAASFVTCIPLFIIYLVFQKYFVGSLAISGIKG